MAKMATGARAGGRAASTSDAEGGKGGRDGGEGAGGRRLPGVKEILMPGIYEVGLRRWIHGGIFWFCLCV